jgi:hypothetical protein
VAPDAIDDSNDLEREKLHRWHERNRIAMEQSRLALSKPLDLAAVLKRVEQRVAERQGE